MRLSVKPRELEALVEAVQAESYRKHAMDIQKGCAHYHRARPSLMSPIAVVAQRSLLMCKRPTSSG